VMKVKAMGRKTNHWCTQWRRCPQSIFPLYRPLRHQHHPIKVNINIKMLRRQSRRRAAVLVPLT
jgi:hypothetical protein